MSDNAPSNAGFDLRTTEEERNELLASPSAFLRETQQGFAELEPYLAKHLAFGRWQAEQERLRCITCEATIDDGLARLGSTRCHDCRGGAA